MAAGFVGFGYGLALVGVHAGFGGGIACGVGGAAFGAAIGESGFIGLQLELFGADGADFDGKGHGAECPGENPPLR